MKRLVIIATIILMGCNPIMHYFNYSPYQKIMIDNGEEYSELRITDEKVSPRADLTYTWYYKHQLHKTIGGYNGHLVEGEFRRVHKESGLKESGTYESGLMDGEWRFWSEEGRLVKVDNYKKGRLNGLSQVFNAAGIIMTETAYKGGVRHGQSRQYIDGQLTVSIKYDKGQPIDTVEVANQ